jgi:hypothetical protein
LTSAQADEFDWLYFPMYARDTAHAVHLSALKRRPDGLLDSATRYPRVPEEQWTKEESAAGWYDYKQRLIDCETGFSIVSREHLLDQDGNILASRDNSVANLAEWKEGLPNAMLSNVWLSASEIFLACAAVGDEHFLAQRRLEGKKKAKALSYSPRIKSLQADTHEFFWRKKQFRLELEPLLKRPPANTRLVFEQLQKQHRAWLSGFAPDMAALMKVGNNAPTAELSEQNSLWLRSHDVHVANVSSRADGAVRYTDRQPNRLILPPAPAYQEPPQNLGGVEDSEQEIYLDCQSGLQIPTRLTWLGVERRQLATYQIGVKPLLEMMQDQMRYRDENTSTNVLLPPSNAGAALWICQAVAAECNATQAAELEPFSLASRDEEAVKRADSPAEALLVVRNAYRNYRRNFIPHCAMGKPF